ncbi:MAG TPA: response regulator [Desulfomonilaceae bacterium]|nr:response regulator [Desulfomonilaceae bacterium]
MSAKPRVLIVDDEERFRHTMCKLLTVEGFEASTAGSGPQGLEELRQRPYDVVILDVRMPEMTGVQVLAEIRKIDPQIEVIIMTGYASVDTAKEIMKIGAYDYLLKPYAIHELIEKIEAAYDRKVARLKLTGREQDAGSHSKS